MPLPLTILLLRHGQTDSNASGTIQGHLPTPLNALGRAQANLLAKRLSQLSPPVDVLVSSDLVRAAQTAEPIAAACNLPIHFDPAWRERYLGTFQGKTVGDRGIWLAATGRSDTPGAEHPDLMSQRIERALLSLPTKYPEARTIAVVTHGGPCKMILRLFSDLRLPTPPTHAPPPDENTPNCSITQLQLNAGLWSLSCLHDVEHLAELVTFKDAG